MTVEPESTLVHDRLRGADIHAAVREVRPELRRGVQKRDGDERKEGDLGKAPGLLSHRTARIT